jgi:hypothetical protein
LAQVEGTVKGLQIQTIEDSADTAEDLSPVGRMFLDAMRCYERGQFKAAAAHAVDAVNTIAAEHSISCGASL